jgi:glycosyltransferase involved in cell wall biosynthesis
MHFEKSMTSLCFTDVSVVMGTRNEEKAIAKVIEDIKRATNGQAEIIVVDGSSDKTPDIAEELGARVIRQRPQGYGVAVKAALLAATREIIITLDCDDTYPAEQIPEFVRRIKDGYDVVSGSRIARNTKNMPVFNRLGNQIFAFITSVLYGIKVTDVTTGMRAYRREVIHSIVWTENVGLSAELLFRPAIMKYKIIEIPIEYRERIGETKLNPLTGGLGIFKSIIKYRFIGDKN